MKNYKNYKKDKNDDEKGQEIRKILMNYKKGQENNRKWHDRTKYYRKTQE